MKISSLVLLITLSLAIAAMFVSNILLKKEYDKIDKSDTYWNYEKMNLSPFRHLQIVGGNLTNISFEPNANHSLRISKNWGGLQEKRVKARVYRDTLFLVFPQAARDLYEKDFMERMTLIRLSAPFLLSIQGFNTNLNLQKMKQPVISVDLSGRSNLAYESSVRRLDSIQVVQRDSSRVLFRISPELHDSKLVPIKSDRPPAQAVVSHSWETIRIRSVSAKVHGVSILDLGHAQMDALRLDVADTSAIILSGGGLKKMR